MATVHGVTAGGNTATASDDAVVEILVHGLVMAKSNDAPIDTWSCRTESSPTCRRPRKGRLSPSPCHYTFSGARFTNGVITDVLPVGLTYVDGSATNSAEFTFCRLRPDDPDPDLERRECHGQWHRDLQSQGRHRRSGPRAAAHQRCNHRFRIRPSRAPTHPMSSFRSRRRPRPTFRRLRRRIRSSRPRAPRAPASRSSSRSWGSSSWPSPSSPRSRPPFVAGTAARSIAQPAA